MIENNKIIKKNNRRTGFKLAIIAHLNIVQILSM